MREAFVGLVEQHQALLFKVANTYCSDRSAREDLVQEIIVQLWRSFGRYDQRRKFATWAYRVAFNVAISFHRGELRRARHLLQDESFLLEVAAPETTDADADLLHSLIESLGDLDRALLLLYLDGVDHATSGDILGISASNVATKLYRIKQRLRLEVAAIREKENAP